MRLLFISEPSAYKYPTSDKPMTNDVPMTYEVAAHRPDIEFFHLPTRNVTGGDTVTVAPVPSDLDYWGYLTLNDLATVEMPIEDFDLVFDRTLKPFPDDDYLHRLAQWEDRVPFLNRSSNKIPQIQSGYLKRVAGPFTAPLIDTTDATVADAFLQQHTTIVAKRPGSYGGRGVFILWKKNAQVMTDHAVEGTLAHADMAAAFAHVQGEPGVNMDLVRFLPRVVEGDKRIITIDGQVWGSLFRRAAHDHWVNNLMVSDGGEGSFEVAEVNDHDRAALDHILPQYQANELRILAIDFLMGDDGTWLISEINAGNIGSMNKIARLTGEDMLSKFLDWMVDHAALRAKTRPTPRPLAAAM